MNSENILFLDVETTTHNNGHPFDPRNRLISYAYAFDDGPINFVYWTDPDFVECAKLILERSRLVAGFNIKFDLHWCNNIGVDIVPSLGVYDSQIAEFIISGQELPLYENSLNNALERYGLPLKKDVVKEYWDAGIGTEDIPVPILEEYNKWDVYTTRLLYQTQQQILSEKQKRLIELEGEDLKALAAAEAAGILFDRGLADSKLALYKEQVASVEKSLSSYLPSGIPDGCFNWDSGDHLSCLLYGGTLEFKYVSSVSTYKTGIKAGQERKSWGVAEVEFPPRFKPLENSELKKTREDPEAKTRYYSTDAPTLLQLQTKRAEDKKLLVLLREWNNKIKVIEMTEGIIKKFNEKNWQGNLIHGQFNQTTVVTGRLSSSSPNLQNQPPEVDEFLVSRYDN